MTRRAAQIRDFLRDAGWQNSDQVAIAGDASNRRYFRLSAASGSTAIVMDAPPESGENVAPFVQIAAYLRDQGLSAPEIYHQDTRLGLLLLEDLGDAVFARCLNQDPTAEHTLYEAATDVLLTLYASPTIPLPMCDADWLTTMVAPLFDWYADGSPDDAPSAFEALFRPFAKSLDEMEKVVILRDYHAENLLWLPDRSGVAKVGVLDFQDALLGHPAYDLISVLQDARRDVSPQIEAAMIARYLDQTGVDESTYRRAYAVLGLQRNLRIIGIFARLCVRDGRAHYLDFIPRVWGYIERNLNHPDLSELAELIRIICPPPTPEYLEGLKAKCATHTP